MLKCDLKNNQGIILLSHVENGDKNHPFWRWSGYISYELSQFHAKREWTIMKYQKRCNIDHVPRQHIISKLKNGSNCPSPEPGMLLEHDYHTQPCQVETGEPTKRHLTVAIEQKNHQLPSTIPSITKSNINYRELQHIAAPRIPYSAAATWNCSKVKRGNLLPNSSQQRSMTHEMNFGLDAIFRVKLTTTVMLQNSRVVQMIFMFTIALFVEPWENNDLSCWQRAFALM